MVNILNGQNSVLQMFIRELRDENIQLDRLRFRRNLERVGEIAAYELSKTLPFTETEVITSLGIAKVPVLKEQPVLATILRAGLPLHQGLLNYFDHADNAFISAYRKTHKDGSFDIHLDYLSSPTLDDRILILSDPMLATGSSIVCTYQALLERGIPSHTHIVAAIASKQGVEYVKRHLPEKVTLWVAVVDDELTVKSYIVPGLGDAGDLAYGLKE